MGNVNLTIEKQSVTINVDEKSLFDDGFRRE